MKTASIAIAALLLGTAPALAAPGTYLRVISCSGPDAAMEIYAPEAVIDSLGQLGLPAKMDGLYALDLSAALKGKHLDPVHLRLSADRKTLTVDQFTRGLPPTNIAMEGGTVDFDNRFGTRTKCGPFSISSSAAP
ncbi:MAG TPA: hypothetical protein VNU97_11975 [Rhizomicrobium sp.]|jgi:hypothetical protein|nr:hypothetical protein [Rhizomicrobium sp.]